jgi:hypothetical protein
MHVATKKSALLNVGVIMFSLLCRAFCCLLISSVFYQEESDDDAAVKEQVKKGMNVRKNEIRPQR